jgi:hypothetical protein
MVMTMNKGKKKPVNAVKQFDSMVFQALSFDGSFWLTKMVITVMRMGIKAAAAMQSHKIPVRFNLSHSALKQSLWEAKKVFMLFACRFG